MDENGPIGAGARLQLLSTGQRREIILAAARVLLETGIVIGSPQARDILARAGARIEGTRAFLSDALLEAARGAAPDRFTLYSRGQDRSKDVEIGRQRAHFGPSITATHFLDPRTGERRPYFLDDAALVARVCDALPNIDYVAAQGTISDVDPDLVEVYEFAALVAHSLKPVMAWSNTLAGCRDIHQIASLAAGSQQALADRPFYFFLGCSISPLTIPGEVAEQLIYCAQQAIPYVFGPCPMCGATTPSTLASTLVVATAECLAALALAQTVRPGAPFIVGGSLGTIDMRRATMPYGAPELPLLCAAETEIAHHLGLPMWSTAGVSDAKIVDEQAAMEGAMGVVVAGLSGADLVHNVGFIEGCLTGSLQYLVMMDEAIGYANRIVRGIEVSPETLGLEWIARIGPGGDFLSTEHTLRHFRSEFWYPRLFDRQTREGWQAEGQKSMAGRVQAQLNYLLDQPFAPRLAPEVQAEIDCVLAAAERRITAGQS
jgi:trimethylamine--corrinoid protein Co-methyltransferase